MKRILILALLTLSFQFSMATVYFVSTSGNDATGNGTSTSPWRSLMYAVTKVAANQGHSIKLSAGTFVENGQFNVPLGVSIEGAGIDQTYIKAASSFYFYPSDPGFAIDKFLMTLSSGSESNGNQSLKNFTIDGDGKKLHGGIYVRFRNNVLIESIKVQNTDFCAIWLWDMKYSAVKQVKLVNGTWGSAGWAAGDLMLSNLDGVEIDGLNVDENEGYGIKALGSSGHSIKNLKLHDSRISVIPNGKWNNGSAPNISVELWQVELIGCEIYNNYMDNHLSLVSRIGVPTVPSSVRVYNNTFDILTRAGGHGYGIELSMSNAEIDHNWFAGGSYGIAHWSTDYMSNWKIHHNTFYGLNSGYPGDIVRAQKAGLHNVKVYNNTVEFTGTTTINFIGLHGGSSDNVELKNNVIINSNTSYTYGTNQLVFMEGGATISGLQVMNNVLDKLPLGSVGGTYSNNKLVGAQVTKSGARPNPYYVPAAGSPLIDAGLNLFTYTGSACDIGAHESGSSAPSVAVSAVTVTPASVTLNVNATTQLTKGISPSNATNQNVSWTSSNMSIASVNASGLVTAGSVGGTATITCRTADGSKTATSTITVVAPIPVLTVSITSLSPSINVGSTSQLTTVIGPANATNKNVTWTSNNGGVASVDANGLVRGITPGTAVITATTVDGNKTATTSIAVIASGNSFDIDNAVVGTGTNQFNYVSAASWTQATNSTDPYLQKTCAFSNVVGSTVTVPFNGTKVELYTAKAANHGIVAVSIDNGPETNVDLYAAARQNYVMVYGSAALTSGSHTIKMRVTGSKNASATGAYTVIDYLKVYTSTTAVAVTGVTVSPATLNMNIGALNTLAKTIAPTNATNQNVVWTSSNAGIASVDPNGVVKAVAAGTATITATSVDGNKVGTSAVTVNAPAPVITSVDLDNNTRGTAVNQFNFSGSGWVHATNSNDGYLQQTVSYSNITNDAATVSFVGNKVEFYSSKATHHGIVGVSIDNGPETKVDLYATTRQSYQMMFSSGALTQGNHTIKIRVTGTKNAAGSGTYAILDYLKVFSAPAAGGGGSFEGASEATAMAEESAKPMQFGPNPLKSGDVLYVNVPEAVGEVTLTNMAGVPQRTLQVTDTSLEIPTSGLFEGIYLLQYRTPTGREIVKIMVQ